MNANVQKLAKHKNFIRGWNTQLNLSYPTLTYEKQYLDQVRFVSHFPDFCHVSELLVDQCALEHDQHEECEQRVVPVLIQAPQTNAKHLKIVSYFEIIVTNQDFGFKYVFHLTFENIFFQVTKLAKQNFF